MGLEKDLPIGNVGDVDVKLDGGNLIIVAKVKHEFSATGTVVENDTVITQPAKILLDKIVNAVPAGWVHDALAAGEQAALAAAGAAPQA